MLDVQEVLSIRHQARVLGVSRSMFYYKPVICDQTQIANSIAQIYAGSSCRYGYRKVHDELVEMGFDVNHKRVQRIMRELGFHGLYPQKKCNTTWPNKSHKVYPYLLDGVKIIRPNQVWATDITYIWIPGKFMYFIAIIDLHSRYVIAYGLNHSLEGEFYVSILKKALEKGTPEIFNTDQGSQFTATDFVQTLSAQNIQISMDHKGRCFDNIFVERFWRTLKQEAIYFSRPESVSELETVLNDFIPWYNTKRRHQALAYKRPEQVYYGV